MGVCHVVSFYCGVFFYVSGVCGVVWSGEGGPTPCSTPPLSFKMHYCIVLIFIVFIPHE